MVVLPTLLPEMERSKTIHALPKTVTVESLSLEEEGPVKRWPPIARAVGGQRGPTAGGLSVVGNQRASVSRAFTSKCTTRSLQRTGSAGSVADSATGTEPAERSHALEEENQRLREETIFGFRLLRMAPPPGSGNQGEEATPFQNRATEQETASAVVDALRHLLSALGAVLASPAGLQAAKDAGELRSLPGLGKSLKRLWFDTPTGDWDSKEQVLWLCRVLAVTEGSRAGILSFYGAGLLLCDAMAAFAEVSLHELDLSLDEAWAAEALAVQEVLRGSHWQQLQQWPADRRCGGGSDPLLSTDRLPKSLKSAFDLEGVRLTKAQAAGLGVAMMMPGSTVLAMGGVGCALLLNSSQSRGGATGGDDADRDRWQVLQEAWLKHAHTLLRRKTCPIEVRYSQGFGPAVIKVTLYALRDVLCALPVGSLGTWGGGGTGGESVARLARGESCRLRPATDDDFFRLRVYRPAPLLDVVLHNGVQVRRGDRLRVEVPAGGEACVYCDTPDMLPQVVDDMSAVEQEQTWESPAAGQTGLVEGQSSHWPALCPALNVVLLDLKSDHTWTIADCLPMKVGASCATGIAAITQAAGDRINVAFFDLILSTATLGSPCQILTSVGHYDGAEASEESSSGEEEKVPPPPPCSPCGLPPVPGTEEARSSVSTEASLPATFLPTFADAQVQAEPSRKTSSVQAVTSIVTMAAEVQTKAEPDVASSSVQTEAPEVASVAAEVQTEAERPVPLLSSETQTEAEAAPAVQADTQTEAAQVPEMLHAQTQTQAEGHPPRSEAEVQTQADVAPTVKAEATQTEEKLQAAACCESSSQTTPPALSAVAVQTTPAKGVSCGTQVERPKVGHQAVQAEDSMAQDALARVKQLEAASVAEADQLQAWRDMATAKALGKLNVTILCPRAECTVNGVKVEMDSWRSELLRRDFEEKVLPRFVQLIVSDVQEQSSNTDLVKSMMEAELGSIFRERLAALLSAPNAAAAMAAAKAAKAA
ncbi:Kcnb2 [Symbiodinium sp. CCMP2592]|nr:Kcnb2 [Symbiodinium sp. CCMP2592]